MKAYTCKKCGGELERVSENEFHCAYCDTTYQDDTLEKAYEELRKNLRKTVRGEIDEAFVQQQELQLAKARQNLWEAVKEENTDSKKILACVRDVKKLMPEDYAANFYELINEEKTKKVVKFLDKVDANSAEGKLWAKEIILFTIKSLKAEYIIPVKDLIERAYKKTDMEQYKEISTLLDEEAKKVEEGIYEVSLPRDVFVMYSSADIEKVKEAVYALEENDVKCFFALRNLQHGVNAVENYDSALKTAMDNCKTVLFISSKCSRSLTCDVVRKELPYLRALDQKHGKKHQKARVEYRLDDTEIPATKRLIRELFDGLEYCGTVEETVERVGESLLTGFEIEEEEKDVKYCKACGAKNELTARFCNACAGGEFVATKEEYNEIQQKRKEEARVQRLAEEAQKKAEEKANALAEELEALRTEKAAELKYCKACGAENHKKVKFCGECGAREFVATQEEYAKIKEEETKKPTEAQIEEWYQKGEDYYRGRNGVEEDETEAVKWYRKAAEQGYAKAQWSLGLCYFRGHGVEKNEEETAKYWQKAAEQGHADAQYYLGNLYYFGHGVEENQEEAAKLFFKAAEQGHANAQRDLGICYFSGQGVEEDEAEAVKWYRKAAEQEDEKAQYRLGECYYRGWGVEEDEAEAVKWYQKAAEQGYAEAQYRLGECYYYGRGVEEDKAEAVKWYQKAAEQGHAEAQYKLGYWYGGGIEGILEEDKVEAVKWYQKAAEQGHADAQFDLGNKYKEGEGVEKDDVEAEKWYRKAVAQYREAAEKGDVKKQEKLGSLYKEGKGVEKDDVEAEKWYRKAVAQYREAAEQGDADAQYELGRCYKAGLGVEQDEAEAEKWWQKSAEQGNELASSFLKLAALMKEWTSLLEEELFESEEEEAEEEFVATQEEYAELEEEAQKPTQALIEEWYQKGCQYFEVGIMKGYSEGGKEWHQKAVEQYRKAAEQGHAKAQEELALSYSVGLGIEKNEAEANKWYRKALVQYHEAAERGDMEAQYKLGYWYGGGIEGILEEDKVEAVKWYQKAAEQGHADAQYRLGECYENGYGVTKNIKEAKEWYQKAAEKGDEAAKEKLKKLRFRLW